MTREEIEEFSGVELNCFETDREEAIKHCLDKSGQCGTECERENKQLAEWLEDYQEKCKLVRYFHNYYPADRHYTCPKCGEYVMEGLICLSCNRF